MTAASAAVAACGLSSANNTNVPPACAAGQPITVGISLPLSGPQQAQGFAPDGQASKKGYELWASDVNSHGGLLGRPVKLIILNDKGDPPTDAKNYRTLITHDHVDLTLAPFSSLLVASAAAKVTAHYGYALTASWPGAPSVYALHDHDLFSTNVPAAAGMLLARWLAKLPGHPTRAAYPMVNDPFADPPVQNAQIYLAKHGQNGLLADLFRHHRHGQAHKNTVRTVLGPVTFAADGENTNIGQFGADLPVAAGPGRRGRAAVRPGPTEPDRRRERRPLGLGRPAPRPEQERRAEELSNMGTFIGERHHWPACSKGRCLWPDGRRAGADLRRARHHQHRPGHRGGTSVPASVYVLWIRLHIGLFVGLLITIPAMFILGVAIRFLRIRPLRGREARLRVAARLLRGGGRHRGILHERFGGELPVDEHCSSD